MPIDPTSVPPPDFDEVSDALHAAGAPQGAADAHGMLCALLCAEPSLDVAGWLDRLDAKVAMRDQELDALHARSHAQLTGESFDLAPFLPEDSTPLDARVRSLGEWCQGFLSGLGLAGIDPARLDDDAAEFVQDLATIAHVTHDHDAEPGPGDEAEEAERDFTQLVEFLRIGTYLVRDALTPANRQRKPS